ncbi:RNA-binding protein hfq [Chroococcidiopsis sp. TS-821]|uniref:Hfq-related RNA-binding protein n=1 Tax=Chroococcidiopsis sp. TS-821 TaxID=1378066 RepID=UPI000CEF41C6|nr:RNA-binding protein hfq [Chroococcidiopsis sp. TS-821]PPS45167.1 RNA-binding protein hfq [Chroococcidiopsis sp. TS-821]
MSNEFDPALPSTRQVQTLIKQANRVELKLVTGDLVIGKISWQDQNCLCIIDANNQTIIVWRSAIAYLKPMK